MDMQTGRSVDASHEFYHEELLMSLPSPIAEVATVGGGCFWCVEAVFEMIDGVRKVESGYAGGESDAPNYEEVCTGVTVFFAAHDPTTLNRQGADVGTQYRSVIFYHNDEQKRVAEDVIRELNADFGPTRPVVTQIVPFAEFHKAEDYHQGYFRSHPGQGYCQAVIAPKVSKVRRQFTALLAKQRK
jgi:peptide-methionine (S)-S-oxide reductase